MMPLGAPSISKYGSLVRPDAQIVALRAHCTRTALKAPPMDAKLLATLQWQPYMDCLRGAAFSEEKLEATLSELQRAKEDDATITKNTTVI